LDTDWQALAYIGSGWGEEMLSKDCKPNPLRIHLQSHSNETNDTVGVLHAASKEREGDEKKIPQMTTKRKFHERNFRVATSKKKAQRLRSRKAGIEPAVEEH